MSTFVNTVDLVGDEALTNSIIDRSITELADNISTTIGSSAFRGCNALTTVNFPNVTSVENAAFYECTALTRADFASCVVFNNNVFYGCKALTALILRSAAVCTLVTTSAFSQSSLAPGIATGYIYVPRALVDTYKADEKWSYHVNQIRVIEDYPEICDPYTWESVFRAIDSGTYASVYKVGDMVPLDLGDEGIVNMQIAGIDVDDKADGSGKAPITWISKELLNTGQRWNPDLVTNDGTRQEGTGAVGGWEKSELRAYMQDTIKPIIPETVRNRLVSVSKTQLAYDTAGTQFTQTTADDVWVPSNAELFGGSSLYYPLFEDSNEKRIKCKVGKSSGSDWWLRDGSNVSYALCTTKYGAINYYAFSYVKATALALGFCT